MLKIMSLVAVILCLSLVTNGFILMQASFSLGLFSIAFTALVFGTALFWIIRLPDPAVHFDRPWLVITALLMGGTVYTILEKHKDQIQLTAITLSEQGHSMLSRNQGLLVITSILLALSLIISSLVLGSKK